MLRMLLNGGAVLLVIGTASTGLVLSQAAFANGGARKDLNRPQSSTGIDGLPDEMFLEILNRLSPCDLAHCAQVSSKWANLVTSSQFFSDWKKFESQLEKIEKSISLKELSKELEELRRLLVHAEETYSLSESNSIRRKFDQEIDLSLASIFGAKSVSKSKKLTSFAKKISKDKGQDVALKVLEQVMAWQDEFARFVVLRNLARHSEVINQAELLKNILDSAKNSSDATYRLWIARAVGSNASIQHSTVLLLLGQVLTWPEENEGIQAAAVALSTNPTIAQNWFQTFISELRNHEFDIDPSGNVVHN